MLREVRDPNISSALLNMLFITAELSEAIHTLLTTPLVPLNYVQGPPPTSMCGLLCILLSFTPHLLSRLCTYHLCASCSQSSSHISAHVNASHPG